MKVLFYDAKPYDKHYFNKRDNFTADITFIDTRLTDKTAVLSKGYDVVCIFVNDHADKKILSVLHENGIKHLALRCAGFNNVDLKAAKELGITVSRVPEYSVYSVAEFTLGLIITLNRKIHKAYNRTRDRNFSIAGFEGFDLFHKTIGIIGTGKIGRATIGALSGLHMNVLGYDPYPNEQAAKELGYKNVSLDELLKESNIISLHCPLTADNEHIIGKEAISKMKNGVIIINTGRGRLVDSHALVEGILSGKVGAAGLDVYEEEEGYFYEDHSFEPFILDSTLDRLLGFNNVIVTSHQAFLTYEALKNIADTTLENIQQFDATGTAKFPVEA